MVKNANLNVLFRGGVIMSVPDNNTMKYQPVHPHTTSPSQS